MSPATFSMSAAAPVPLRVLVVDDEALARARLQTLLSDCRAPAAVVVAQAANAVEARTHLAHHAVDLVLLDIQLPGVDGLALAQSIQAIVRPPAVVFVTAHTEHALQAFELEAVDYLTKPVRLERLQQALQKVVRSCWGGASTSTSNSTSNISNGASAEKTQTANAAKVAEGAARTAASVSDVLVIQERNRTERVPLNSILYFKAELKYVTVRTAQRSYLLDASLNVLEQRYGDRFLRVHRNAMVARWAAVALEKTYDAEEGEAWAIHLEGLDSPNERLLVSRRQLSAVRDLLAR